MPSSQHEVPVRLFQNNPALAMRLFGRPELVPPYKKVLPASEVHTNCKPTQIISDNVEICLDEEGKPVFAIIVEIQKQPDPKKKRRWLGYLADLAIRLECPVALIVIALNDSVARWCRTPFEVGHPGLELIPVVIGPSEIPVINNPADATGNLEMTILSALAHASEPGGKKILEAVEIALLDLPPDEAVEYANYTISILEDEARDHMEALMAAQTYDYQSRWTEKFRAEGEKRGLEQGRELGKLAQAQEMLQNVVSARGFVLSPEHESRISECKDVDQLNRWATKAVTAESVDDVFAS